MTWRIHTAHVAARPDDVASTLSTKQATKLPTKSLLMPLTVVAITASLLTCGKEIPRIKIESHSFSKERERERKEREKQKRKQKQKQKQKEKERKKEKEKERKKEKERERKKKRNAVKQHRQSFLSAWRGSV